MGTSPLSFLCSAGAVEGIKLFSINRMAVTAGLDLLQELLSLATLSPTGSKLIGSAWHQILKAVTNTALRRAGEGGEEVGGGLAVRAIETHVDEKTPSIISPAKVNLAAFVENDSFVENIVNGLASLIDGHNSSRSTVLG